MKPLCFVVAVLLSLDFQLLAISAEPITPNKPVQGEVQDYTTGVYISYGGRPIKTFKAGTHADVATMDGGRAEILTCVTDKTSCCGDSDNPNGQGFGQWYYPNGEMVVNGYEDLPDEQLYMQQRGHQYVRLVRVVDKTMITPAANGIYRCEVPDKNGVIQTRYVGLYTETTDDPNGVGVISISEGPDFSLISDNPLLFNLTTITTGGPPAVAFWTLPNGTDFNVSPTSQTVLDYESSTVSHTLTVTEALPGEVYTFTTTNRRSALEMSSCTVPGVYLSYGGSPILNFEVETHEHVATSDGKTEQILTCVTDNSPCCGDSENPNGQRFGQWYYPNGEMVVNDSEDLPDEQLYIQQRGPQNVRLVLVNESNITPAANGVYRCEVPDKNGVIQTRYIGLYTETSVMPNGVGVVSISEGPDFSLISDNPLGFTVTTITTGGPPAVAFWTLPNGTKLKVSPTSQRVLDYESSTVSHTLTVTEALPREVYTFTTTNRRSGLEMSSFTVPGVSLSYGGCPIKTFKAGTHADVATMNGGRAEILTCETDKSSCCGDSDNPNGQGFGQWYYPSGEMVVNDTEDLPDEQLYIQQRGHQYVRLVRVVDNSNITPAANGIYRCEVPDKNGVIQTRYVGLYTETTVMPKGVGTISISEGPDFSLISDNPLVFNLTTITTGGPPAVAFWTLPNGTEFSVSLPSQTVLDYENSTVSHTLTVTEALPGEVYTFTTTNRRSAQEMSSFTVPGVYLSYGGSPIEVLAMRSHKDVATIDGEPQQILACVTDNSSCCGDSDNPNGRGFGQWYYTNEEKIVSCSEDLPDEQLYIQQRGPQYVRLVRVVNESNITPTANGFYRCDVPDKNGVIQTRYVGLYTETNEIPNGVGVISISEGPDFSLISVNPLKFTLTTITTGGPPADTFWTLPNGMTLPPTSHTVLDYKTSTVSHTLTVTEALPGEVYTMTFTTTNLRSTQEISSITVQAANPPSYLTAVQRGPNSITVSWTPPAPGGPTRTGYRIFIETDDSEDSVDVEAYATSHTQTGLVSGETYNISIVTLSAILPSEMVGPEMVTIESTNPPTDLTAVQSGPNSVSVFWTAPAPGGATRTGYRIFIETDDSDESVDVEADATSHTLTDLEIGETYNISIVALCTILTSDVVGPEMVTIEEPMMPHVKTRVLDSTSIAVTFIQLSGLPAERYDIEYTRVTGAGQTLCPVVKHADNKTDIPSPYIIITDLEEFSNYTFAVTAHFFSSTVRMTTERVEDTLHAPPTGFPMNLAVRGSIEATFVPLRWRQVPCIERNGVIRNYIVRYGPESGEMENVTTPGQMRRFTVDRLTPSTDYTFEVAAENSAGVGPFTPPLKVKTTIEAPPGPVVRVVVFMDTAAMTIAWDQPDPPNGAIQYYDIEYCDKFGSNLVNVSHGVRPFNRVNRDTSKVLTGLKPDTTYSITITPYNSHEGNSMSFTAKTLSIPRVSGYRVMGAFNTTAVKVSWFAVNVAHIDDLYYKLRYHISSRPSDSTIKVVSDGLTSAVVDFESPEVAELEHTFSVAVAYKIEGEEFEGEFSNIPQLSDTDVMICDFGNEVSNGP